MEQPTQEVLFASSDGILSACRTLTQDDADPFGRLRLRALLRMIQESSCAHTALLGVGQETLRARGAFWALSRMRVTIDRLPKIGETVRLSTWPGDTAHTVFPRFYRLCGENGETLLAGAALWLLMDEASRRMALPGPLGVRVDGVQTGCEPPLPGPLHCAELPEAAARTARYSQIDQNGHMNNTCYPDWLDDLFSPGHHAAHVWRDVQINYQTEIPCGATVALHADLSKNPCPIYGCMGDQIAFSACVRYE